MVKCFSIETSKKELSDEYLTEVEHKLSDAYKETDLLITALLDKLGTAETVTVF